MPRKSRPTAGVDAVIAKSIDFEVTLAEQARRSERNAWWVACAAALLALMLGAGYLHMLPLKEKVPYLVMADAYTGTSTVAKLVAGPEYQHITTSEAVNRSNVARYLVARESYDVTLLNLRDWNAVLTMSTPDIAAGYRSLYSPSNIANPAKRYGAARSIRVKINSIVLVNARRGQTPTGAMVRFQRSIYTRQTGAVQPLDNKIATLAFVYNPNLKMDERYRLDNPLGFLVTDYRVDDDFDSMPPMAVDSGTPPVAQAGRVGVPSTIGTVAAQVRSGEADAVVPGSAGADGSRSRIRGEAEP